MNTLRFKRNESVSSLAQRHQKSKPHRRFRHRLLVMTAAFGLLLTSAVIWQQRSHAAPDTGHSGNRLTELISRAGKGLRSALALSPAPAQSAQGGLTISTIAGGGFDVDLPAGQAPAGEPAGVIRDALGRGFFVLDARPDNGPVIIRFVNTSAQSVTLAGVTISPGNINLIAGGADQIVGDVPLEIDLERVTGMAVDPSGNALYLLRPSANALIGINLSAQPFTIGGKTIPPGRLLELYRDSELSAESKAQALSFDPQTGYFYFSCNSTRNSQQSPATSFNKVYRIDVAGGQLIQIAGTDKPLQDSKQGKALEVKLNEIKSTAVENSGAILLAERGDDAFGGAIHRITGDTIGPVTNSESFQPIATCSGASCTTPNGIRVAYPTSVTVAPNGDIYVANGNSQEIIKVNPVTGAKSRVVGSGKSGAASLTSAECPGYPSQCGDGGSGTAAEASIFVPGSNITDAIYMISADNSGVYIPGLQYNRVRFVNTTNGPVTLLGKTLAAGVLDSVVGANVPAPYDHNQAVAAVLNKPAGVISDAQGNIFIADTFDGHLRFVNRTQQPIDLFTGTPSAQTVQPGEIVSLDFEPGSLYEDQVKNANFNGVHALARTSQGVFIVFPNIGSKCGISPSAPQSGTIRFLNTTAANVTVLGVTVAPGAVKEVAGNKNIKSINCNASNPPFGDGGKATDALIFPAGIAVDSAGDLYLADLKRDAIRKIDSSGNINLVTVNSSDGTPITLNDPTGVALTPTGQLVLTDLNNRVLRQNAAGSDVFTVIADASSGLNKPRGLTVDSTGNVYVLNSGNQKVLQISAPSNALGTVTTVAGTGTAGFKGDGGPAVDALISLANPTTTSLYQQALQITTLPGGDIIFTDSENSRIRLLKKEVNLAPALASIADQTMTEGETKTVQFSATDLNLGDSLSFSITNKPGFGTFTDNGNRTASLALAPGLTDSGDYTITITVSDGQLNDSKTFKLTVNDSNHPPTVSAGTIASPINATSASGASVNLTGTVTDSDGDTVTWKWFDGATQIASGADTVANTTVTLALGAHSIYLEGADSKGAKTSTAAQTVLVRDTIPPVIGDIPANQVFEADTLGGKVYTFTNPTVTDNLDPAPKLQVNGVPAGNKYPVGTTVITFIATDAGGNTSQKSFTVRVTDTQKPTISGVPANQVFEADTLGGKVFTFANPTATDLVSGNITVTASGVPPGNLYPVGTTTVNFLATDGAGNQATASFTVTVTDTIKPVISGVPSDITAEATSAQGAVVNYTLPTATDIVDGAVTVMADKAPGSIFPFGLTTVNFAAKDKANNTTTASFKVTVQDTTPPVFGPLPGNKTVGTGSASGTNVNFDLPTATDAVDGAVTVTASPASGSFFPVGNTTVTLTTKDSRNNTATASFVVTVVNVPPPTISGVPADITVEATSPAGAVVSYVMPTAVSGQGAALTVATTNPPGSIFPIATTTVTFTATDNLGLSAQKTFKVTVVDTKPPVFNGDTPNITTEALTSAGAVVNFAVPTATDVVDGNVNVSSSHASGSTFPIGITTVTLTAKDSRQNTATRTFTITVLADVSYLISTFAGNGTYGNSGDGGQATGAQFKQIVALARDKQGRLLVLDSGNRSLRRIETDGTITLVAGNGSNGNGGDGKQATTAQFNIPSGVAVDSNGNIYVADLGNNRVRVIAPNGVITHFAGDSGGAAGSTGDQGTAAGAKLRQPRGLAVDKNDNLFIADSGNHRIRRVDAVTRVITTVAGTGGAGFIGDGALATTLNLNNPNGVAVDAQGNLYIADTFNQRIRRVDGVTQIMTTLTGSGVPGFSGDDGAASLAQVNNPTGVAVDSLGNVFVADTNNNRLRRISKATGRIRTVAGTGLAGFSGDGGPAAQAQVSAITAVISDDSGNTVFAGDSGNLRVRKLMAGSANKPPVITSAIGNQTMAKNQTLDLALTATDEDNDSVTFTLIGAPAFATITNANPAQRTATLHLAPTQAGTFNGIQVKADDGKGGTATSAAFSITVNDPPPGNNPPTAMAGALPAMIEATGPAGVTVSLNGSGSDADNDPLSFTWKDGVTVIATTANASVTLGLGTHSLTLTVSDGKGGSFTTPAQTVLVKDSTPPVISNVPASVTTAATSAAGAVVTYTLPTAIDLVSGPAPVTADVASGATFPVGTTTVNFTAKDAAGNTATASFTVTVTPQGGGGDCNTGDQSYSISTYAGNGMYGYSGDGGPATSASVRMISALARDKNGVLYIADSSSRVVRRVDPSGIITTLAGTSAIGNTGDGKQALSANFSAPSGVAIDSKGNIYIADSGNHRIRVVGLNGVITHFAGNTQGDPGSTGDGGLASGAKLRQPRGLAIDKNDNLYIADTGNHRIRRVDAVTKVITTVAGNGIAGFGGDGSAAVNANLNLPVDLAIDAQGNLYIADSFNHRIRRVDAATQTIATVVGTGTAGFSGDDGPAPSAQLNLPSSVAVDCGGNIYVADAINMRVRRVSKSTGKIKTIAGSGQAGFAGDGGPATSALLSQPATLAIDETGNTVFVGDTGSQRVRKLAGASLPPPNNAPVVGSVASQTMNTGQVIDLPVSATDQDNDPVTFTLSNAPAFVTLINASPAQRTVTLHLAPGANDTGVFTNLVVQASDGKGGTAQSNAFSITVNNTGGGTNRPPVAVITGGATAGYDATSPAGAPVPLDGAQSSDPDSDPLSFQWTEGATVLGTGARITVPLSVGTHVVTLTVSDGKGGTGTATQTITVRPFVISNDPVTLTSIDPVSGRQGQTLDVTLTGTGFQPGAKVTFSGEGITATVTALTSTQIIAKVVIASNAPTGSGLSTRRSVTLMNLNNTTSTLNKVFAVYPR